FDPSRGIRQCVHRWPRSAPEEPAPSSGTADAREPSFRLLTQGSLVGSSELLFFATLLLYAEVGGESTVCHTDGHPCAGNEDDLAEKVEPDEQTDDDGEGGEEWVVACAPEEG